MVLKFSPHSLKLMLLSMLPYFSSLVLIYSAPLQMCFFRYIHFFALGLCFIVLLWCNITKHIILNKYLLGVLFVIVLWIPISAYMLPAMLIPLIGAFDYLMPLFFWLLFFNCEEKRFSISAYCLFLIIVGTVIGLAGIYQRFVDPSLFGLMTGINSRYDIDMALLQHLNSDNQFVFRVSSFLISTQAYSLFMGLATSLLIVLWHEIRLKCYVKAIILLIHIFSGMLAGGKAYIVVLFLTFIFSLFTNKTNYEFLNIKKFCGLIIFATILGFVIWLNNDSEFLQALIRPLNRILLVFTDRQQSTLDESIRISIMFHLFDSEILNVFLGHGLGTSSYSAFNALGDKYYFSRFTTESFMLSWWWEMGIFGFLAFLTFYLNAIKRAMSQKSLLTALLLSLFIAMTFTPAFYNLNLFPVWGLFIYYSQL